MAWVIVGIRIEWVEYVTTDITPASEGGPLQKQQGPPKGGRYTWAGEPGTAKLVGAAGASGRAIHRMR